MIAKTSAHQSIIKVDGYQGMISPTIDNVSLLSFLSHTFKTNFNELTQVKVRSDRQVWQFTFEGKKYFLKRYISSSIRSFLKYLLGINKASLSCKMPGYLAKYGVKTPNIVTSLTKYRLFFQLEEIHISEEIPNAISLRSFVQENIYTGYFTRKQKLAFYQSFALFLANIHKAGIYHGDFTSRNIYIENTFEKNYPLYLIDLDAVRSVKWISQRRRIKNLDEIGRNFRDFAKISLLDRARVVRSYMKFYENERTSFKVFFKEICQRTRSRLN